MYPEQKKKFFIIENAIKMPIANEKYAAIGCTILARKIIISIGSNSQHRNGTALSLSARHTVIHPPSYLIPTLALDGN
jgi:hypothetical protein